MGLFVTIHGIDGTGKTTTARRLSVALHSAYSGSLYFGDIAMPCDDTGKTSSDDPYTKSVRKKIAQSNTLLNILSDDCIVSKDRWMIDVAASSAYLGNTACDRNPEGVYLPDLSVLLTCSEAERARRINVRGNATADDKIPNTPGTRAYYFESFLKEHLADFAAVSLKIDTTNRSPEEVTNIITEAVQDVSGI